MSRTLNTFRSLALVAMGAALALSVLLAIAPVPAHAVFLAFDPSAQIVLPGSVMVDIVVSGLGAGVAPSVGAFDFDVFYDPSILMPTGVTFGGFLGITGVETVSGFVLGLPVDLAELSFLAAGTLDALQPASFKLATLMFTTVGVGTSPLMFTPDASFVLDDAFGSPLSPGLGIGSITVTPEPSTLLAMGVGFAGLVAWCWRRQR